MQHRIQAEVMKIEKLHSFREQMEDPDSFYVKWNSWSESHHAEALDRLNRVGWRLILVGESSLTNTVISGILESVSLLETNRFIEEFTFDGNNSHGSPHDEDVKVA
jgi:hypothetical protein